MEGRERDSTQDWLISEESAPPLLEELEERIDEALAVAREAEDAVESIGFAAIEAAEQSREAAEQACRAAELAERASAAMHEQHAVVTAEATGGRSTPIQGMSHGGAVPTGASGDDGLRSFTERADRIVARLRELERLPAAPGA